MGSEDLFSKRKAALLKRKKAKRTAYKRYLIVCEGEKTEPQYFKLLLSDFGIQTKMVHIAQHNGATDPKSIVRYASGLYKKDAKTGDKYDKVYCVFDRDSHPNFDAVQQGADLSKKKWLTLITSTPCFEFWLLLHFSYTAKAFCPAGNKSAGDRVVRELKTKPGFRQYSKSQKDIYAKLKDRLCDAVKNAKRLHKDCVRTGSDNPSTNIHILIQDLWEIKKEMSKQG